MILHIDCGVQTITAAEIRTALADSGISGCTVMALPANEYHVELSEVVQPGELQVCLNKYFDRNDPISRYSGYVDSIKVREVQS
jgi:hypothetical protein